MRNWVLLSGHDVDITDFSSVFEEGRLDKSKKKNRSCRVRFWEPWLIWDQISRSANVSGHCRMLLTWNSCYIHILKQTRSSATALGQLTNNSLSIAPRSVSPISNQQGLECRWMRLGLVIKFVDQKREVGSRHQSLNVWNNGKRVAALKVPLTSGSGLFGMMAEWSC